MKHPYKIPKMAGCCHHSVLNAHTSSYVLLCAAFRAKLYLSSNISFKQAHLNIKFLMYFIHEVKSCMKVQHC